MDINTYESTLEDMVINNIEFVRSRGFPEVYDKTNHQVSLPNGKICDIVSYEVIGGCLSCKIFELKRGELTIAALSQLIDYGSELAKYSFFTFEEVKIELYLVGSDISSELLALCAWGIDIKIVLFDYKVDGIHFEEWPSRGVYPKPYWLNGSIAHRRPDEEVINNWRKLFE